MVPFDWGQTSVTYRTDLFDLDGQEESWGMLWDERYKGRMGVLASAADTWWCGAIYAGVDFKELASDENFKKVAEIMRKQRPLIRVYTDDTTTLEQALASGETGRRDDLEQLCCNAQERRRAQGEVCFTEGRRPDMGMRCNDPQGCTQESTRLMTSSMP